MKLFVICAVFVAYLAAFGDVSASTEPVCLYEPEHKFLKKDEHHLIKDVTEPNICIKRVTCDSDYNLVTEECADAVRKVKCDELNRLEKIDWPKCCETAKTIHCD